MKNASDLEDQTSRKNCDLEDQGQIMIFKIRSWCIYCRWQIWSWSCILLPISGV